MPRVRLVNFLTGVTPVRLLKISTRRLAGQAAAISPRAFSLVKTSIPSVLGAALAEAWNVMLLSASMVNAFICSPCRAVGPRGHHTDHSRCREHQVKSAGGLKNQG